MNDCMTQGDAMNMNNEQAVSILIPLRDMMRDQYGCPISDAYFALDKAIEALKQLTQPNTPNTLNALDTISRQAAIDALEKVADMFPWRVPGNRDTYDRYNEAWNDAIGRAEMEIENIPSVQPERKPGRWETYIISMLDGEGCRCSECGIEGVPYWDFCPNCGADMRSEQDDSI